MSQIPLSASEDQILDWLRRQPQTAGLIGDDAAFLPRMGACAVTVDRQAAGVHFPGELDAASFARRLVLVNLSDLAAAGAAPVYAFLALAVPADFDHRRFFRALLSTCRRYGLVLAGGDLSRSATPQATLTLVGRRVSGGRWLTRRAAGAGHRLWVGGTLGESAAGAELLRRGARLEGRRVELPPMAEELLSVARRAVRRHLNPGPQLELGAWLAVQRPTPAAIDLSDGLALDLRRLCRSSGVGAVVEEARLPLAPKLARLAQTLGRQPLDLALGGGEDYVLLFSLVADRAPPQRFRCHPIGRLTGGRSIELAGPDGTRRTMPRLGWDHFAEPG